MSEKRWMLNDVTPNLNRFRVYDNIMKRPSTYFIPKLMSVKIDGNKAIVDTKAGKHFLINLDDSSRQLLA